jgi:hypothetical protein
MDPIVWLRERLPGFPAPHQEGLLRAITDFALLWSCFEGMAMATGGSPSRIIRRVQEWQGSIQLQIAVFAAHVEYFRNRYCPNGVWDPQYSMLVRFTPAQERLLRRVLQRQTEDTVECVTGVLLLVLRLRNNLFHGQKMIWGLRDQADNFHHASLALMNACDVERAARDAGLAPMEAPE